MPSNPKPARTRARGLVLTEDALKLLDEALRKSWETSGENQLSETGRIKKLSREARAEKLGMDAKTVDKVYGHIGVEATTLETAFKRLNIHSPFSKEQHCVSSPSPSGNLPCVPTDCIGRETEIAAIRELLESFRLVTLTGTGGVGKTRLAIQVAEETKGDFAAGVWFVDLASVADPALVLQEVAATLGVKEKKRSRLQALADFLRGKSLLLILDNCEHLSAACATLADRLLSASSCLRILATSRERLNIRFERPCYVPSLAVSDAKILSSEPEEITAFVSACDAVRLFVERARLLRPDFAVTAQNALLLASICRRLDGIPLAIELAAARVRALSLEALDRGLNDCFHLLTGGSPAALPRQQTLRATMDWSYNLLAENEKTLLRRLSVFAGGGTLEAVEQVCGGEGIAAGEVLDLLTALVDKNLVLYEETAGKARYRLLETVRQYGRDRLAESGERDAVQERHRDYFLALAEAAEPHLKGPEQATWLQRLEAEHDNLRAALEWSLAEADSEAGLRLCKALNRFWCLLGYWSESREWYARALQKPDAPQRTAGRAQALKAAGELACYQSDFAAARTLHQQSLTLYQELDNLDGIARAFNGLASVAEAQGNYACAQSHYEQSLNLFRELANDAGVANLLKNLGYVAYYQNDYASAHRYIKESLARCQKTGNRIVMACSLTVLGLIARAEENHEAARAYFEQSLALCREVKDREGIAYAFGNLGNVALDLGEAAAARTLYEQSLALWQDIDNRHRLVCSLEAFARLSAHTGIMERAAVLWGAAAALREQIGIPQPPQEQKTVARELAKLHEVLDDEAFSAAWEQGGSMTLEEAIAYALETPIKSP